MQYNIPLTQAIEMTKRYRENQATILKPEYVREHVLATCETFSKEAFEPFLSNPACKSIRIYYGMDASLKVHAIVVGADSEGRDILPPESMRSSENVAAADGDGNEPPIVEDADRCPEDCPPPSPLNP